MGMYVLGIDIGTTGAKTLAFDETGRVAGRGYREYPLEVSGDGHVTQNAADWWDSAVASTREAVQDIDKRAVSAIGISTQGASMLAVDCNFDPLCAALTWMDRRASAEAGELASLLGEEEIYRKTGYAANAALDAAKIAWIKNNWPEIYENAASFVSTLEFVNYKLTKKNLIDPTNAGIRQLYNINSGKWDSDILSFLHLDEKRLPAILPSGDKIGRLSESAALELGLTGNVRVYNGAHDQYCAAIGSGAVSCGDMLLATGTAWVVFAVTNNPLYTASRISPGIFPQTGRFGALVSMSGVGAALKWWNGIIGGDYAEMDSQAEKKAPDMDMLAYPYAAGAGFNHDPNSKAAFIGLNIKHGKYDVARALMEGAAFETRMVLEEFSAQGMEIRQIIMTGGASKSKFLGDLVALATKCEVVRLLEKEAACMGAAALAAIGEGWFEKLEDAKNRWVKFLPAQPPNGDYEAFYEEKYGEYKKMHKKIYE
ncbi:MAG: FGGY family carbohydrate kinase [Oscillospiraceae bacterium]|nr:FGGY family carbohydrate kinase [Oscillospiraceae bacterium]